MAKFIFKLQSILNLRKQKEDSVKTNWRTQCAGWRLKTEAGQP